MILYLIMVRRLIKIIQLLLAKKSYPKEPKDIVLFLAEPRCISIARYCIAEQPKAKCASKYVNVLLQNDIDVQCATLGAWHNASIIMNDKYAQNSMYNIMYIREQLVSEIH